MQHGRLLPSFARLRQWALALAIALSAAPLSAEPARIASAEPLRVLSLNMCTDQILIDLAPPARILGLSPFARDAARSWAASRAEGLPVLSGTAEEVMVLRPDLVVSGRFTRRATREFVHARGIRIEEFDAVRTLAEARRQIARFGEITGARDRATARIAEMDAALADLRQAASATRLRVLPLSRRGWAAGRDSLMSELLAQAGLANAATELGLRAGGFVTLEAIVRLKPDAILVTRDDGRAEDQGRAMLLHPALDRLFPPGRRIVVPEKLTICGGPMLAEAMRSLAAQVRTIRPRDADPR